MEILVSILIGLAMGFFIFANLYDRKVLGKKETIVSVIFRVDDAKLCGNCSAVYDAMEQRCCPKCTSTMGLFIINHIESTDPKVELVKQHMKDIREGKFRKAPKPEKVIQLDTAREEKVSASDLA